MCETITILNDHRSILHIECDHYGNNSILSIIIDNSSKLYECDVSVDDCYTIKKIISTLFSIYFSDDNSFNDYDMAIVYGVNCILHINAYGPLISVEKSTVYDWDKIVNDVS